MVMVSEALTIGRCYGIWCIASCTMVFAVEEERKHQCAYFSLPHRGCPMCKVRCGGVPEGRGVAVVNGDRHGGVDCYWYCYTKTL